MSGDSKKLSEAESGAEKSPLETGPHSLLETTLLPTPQQSHSQETEKNLQGSEQSFSTLSIPRIDLGQIMFGRYRIEKPLGEGGMGAVYLAHDLLLDRKVALKIPKFKGENREQLSKRFRREAQSAAKLNHRNICPLYDVGSENGIDYLTMAYIEGKPLSDYVNPSKPLPQRQVALVVRKLAGAVKVAHAVGIIHRDLKPSNVLIDAEGEPVVMDFGLAGKINGTEESRLTESGMILGTPAYMAPEQIQAVEKLIGPSSDVYSLGIVMYELLTGRLPFRGSAASVMAKAMVAKPPAIQTLRPEIDIHLIDICEAMIVKHPAKRIATMEEVMERLSQWLRSSQSSPSMASASQSATHSAIDAGAGNEPSAEFKPNLNNDSLATVLPAVAPPLMPERIIPVIEVIKPHPNRSASVPSRYYLIPALCLLMLPLLFVGYRAMIAPESNDQVTALAHQHEQQQESTAPAAASSLKIDETWRLNSNRNVTENDPEKPASLTLENSGQSPIASGQVVMESRQNTAAENVMIAQQLKDNRELAAWVVRFGGNVALKVFEDDQWRNANAARESELPNAPFLVGLIVLGRDTPLTNENLQRIAKLNYLNYLAVAHLHSFGAEQMQVLVNGMTECPITKIVAHNSGLSSSNFGLLRDLPVSGITISGQNIDDDWQFLEKLPNLRRLYVQDGGLPPVERLTAAVNLSELVYLSEPTAAHQVLFQAYRDARPRLRILSGQMSALKAYGEDTFVTAATELTNSGWNVFGADFLSSPWSLSSVTDRPPEHMHTAIFPQRPISREEAETFLSLSDFWWRVSAVSNPTADSVANHLRKLRIANIDFSNSSLTDEGMKSIEHVAILWKLNVQGTRVSRAAIDRFREKHWACVIDSDFGKLTPDFSMLPPVISPATGQ